MGSLVEMHKVSVNQTIVLYLNSHTKEQFHLHVVSRKVITCSRNQRWFFNERHSYTINSDKTHFADFFRYTAFTSNGSHKALTAHALSECWKEFMIPND